MIDIGFQQVVLLVLLVLIYFLPTDPRPVQRRVRDDDRGLAS